VHPGRPPDHGTSCERCLIPGPRPLVLVSAPLGQCTCMQAIMRPSAPPRPAYQQGMLAMGTTHTALLLAVQSTGDQP
jgi:hypothetical protein